MTENIISWNVANWMTVVLMAALGFALFTLAAKTMQKVKEANND